MVVSRGSVYSHLEVPFVISILPGCTTSIAVPIGLRLRNCQENETLETTLRHSLYLCIIMYLKDNLNSSAANDPATGPKMYMDPSLWVSKEDAEFVDIIHVNSDTLFGVSYLKSFYRVTIQLVANLSLTSKPKFRFGLAWPSQAKAEHLFCSQREVRHKLNGHPVLHIIFILY